MDNKIEKAIEEYKKNIDTLLSKYFIGNKGIYNKDQENITFEQSMNKENNSELINFIKNKLNIVDKIEKDNISEFRSGADKILEPEHIAYSYKLTIYVDNKIFYVYAGTTDDFKYGGNAKDNNELLLNMMMNKKNMYIKLLVNSFINIYNKINIIEEGVKDKTRVYVPNSPRNTVVYGGKKK